MGCTTNGFVLTKEKNPFTIYKLVKEALVKEMMNEVGTDNRMDVFWKHEDKFTSPSCEISDFTEMMDIRFKFAGENRELSVFLSCDSDYSYYKKGKKIITSLGAWGQSVRLTEIVLQSLAEFGSLHIVDNDCSDEWRELLPAPAESETK